MEGGVHMQSTELWTYPQAADVPTMDMTGFSVEATDGSIGKVDEASNDAGASYIVVDTGPWIFGKKVVLPAGTVTRVEREDKRVLVDRSKDEIKDAPEFDPDHYRETEYRDRLSGYYTSRR
jgi:hypothetical protein